EFTDCCQCISPNGPCASSLAIDKPRSIEMLSDRATGGPHPAPFSVYQLLNQAMTYIILLCIVVCVAIVVRRRWKSNRRKRLSSYNIDYQKLNVNYSRKYNLNRRQTLAQDEEDVEEEVEEDDDEELTLFEKT